MSDITIIIMINAAPLPDSVAVKNYGVNRILTNPVLSQTLKQALLEEFYFLYALGEGATEESK